MAATELDPKPGENALHKYIPFLKDVQEKGFPAAAAAKTNDIVKRITAGLDISDMRAVMRGDAPGRPNPRLTPHADAFLYHIRPSYYHQDVAGIYPTFKLGWFSFFFFMVELITGLFLMIFYTPSPSAAYSDMINMLARVPLGQFMRDLHRWGAELMVAVVALHMLRTFLTGSYKKPRQFTWATGVILLLVTLFLSFSGYLLPWDQLSLWAVTIGTSMAEKSPTPFPIGQITGNPEFMGYYVNLIMRGGPDIREAGLLRWYLLHVFALPIITLLFIGVHYYKVIIHGHSLPPEKEGIGEDTARKVPADKRVYFTPDVLAGDLIMTGLGMAFMIFYVAFVYHAPLEHHADPQITPLHTTAPWYFLWLQGLLKLGDPGFMGVVLPTILGIIVLAVPYFDVGPSRRYGDRRIGITMGLLFSAWLIVLTFMGTPRFLVQTSGDQEIMQNALPQEGVGPLRTVPFEKLTPGVTYKITATSIEGDLTNNPELEHALKTIQEDLAVHYIPANWPNGGLENAYVEVLFQDWQPGLKKVTIWVYGESCKADATGAQVCVPIPPDKTNPEKSSTYKSLFIHADSNYAAEGGH